MTYCYLTLYQGNLYGTRLDSVRAIIDEGRTAVLDPSPRSLKLLRNSSEFMPFIVFLGKRIIINSYEYIMRDIMI